MEEAIVAHLLAAAGVAAIVGDRITFGVRDQAADLPALVLNLIDRVPVYSDEGEAGLNEARLQTDAYAETAKGAKALARAVRASLSGAAFTAGGVEFQAIFQENEQELFERSTGGDELRRVSIDFLIWHT